MKDIVAVVLAAGRGERMKSRKPKVLHPIGTKPMLGFVLDLLIEDLKLDRVFVVTGHKQEEVRGYIGKRAQTVLQDRLLGTADAVKCIKKVLPNFSGSLLILYADTPLLRPITLRRLIRRHSQTDAPLTLLTAEIGDPTGFGRIIRDSTGKIKEIIEENEADRFQKIIKEVNAGVYCFRAPELFSALDKVRPSRKKGEYYLTDIISILYQEGKRMEAVSTPDPDEVLGVNSRLDLIRAFSIFKRRQVNEFLSKGVTILEPDKTFIGQDVRIGMDTVIFPYTIIESDVSIGRNCTIGPFCHIRPGTRLTDNVKVGNFVELNRSYLKQGSMVKHFSYLGDARVGKKVNIGAGTITANFDGKAKNVTVIEDNAFIGTGTILIAPVKVGKSAVTGAGCVVPKRKDIPAGSVVVGVPARPLSRKNKRC
jgi:bifunctional UDP-N-acetylglucosamine pyrophosphorylase/glucosamine-1-phosphate N-acetyltransferase